MNILNNNAVIVMMMSMNDIKTNTGRQRNIISKINIIHLPVSVLMPPQKLCSSRTNLLHSSGLENDSVKGAEKWKNEKK